MQRVIHKFISYYNAIRYKTHALLLLTLNINYPLLKGKEEKKNEMKICKYYSTSIHLCIIYVVVWLI